ncbi:hypothetical protein AB1L12_26280 [Peribacillus frigoritolerans]
MSGRSGRKLRGKRGFRSFFMAAFPPRSSTDMKRGQDGLKKSSSDW